MGLRGRGALGSTKYKCFVAEDSEKCFFEQMNSGSRDIFPTALEHQGG